ncbi:ATP-dependent DNA helicase PIF1-like protein [Tanacetum coccineum]
MNHTLYATMNRDKQDKDRITPSLSDSLKKSLRIYSNTTIRQDGRVQSYCGLTITKTDADCLGPLSLRAGRKTLKKAALTSTGVPVTYHNLGPPSHQCRNCHATMWYKERGEVQNDCQSNFLALLSRRNCTRAFIDKDTPEPVDEQIVRSLIQMLDEYSSVAKKRGLPHAHILLWLEEHSKYKTPSEIDDIISAELPSPIDDPAGYKVASEYMLHGPCRKDARYTTCTNDGKCSKHFPKPFLAETFLDEEGYPHYRRRDNKDAMALCRAYGNPDLFITFTSNPKWPEIAKMLAYFPGQKAHDRPKVRAHIFKLKLTELLDDLTKKHVFGQSEAVIYVIEFQKRGLPHAHILLWLEEHSKYKTPSEIDDIISAELPSPTNDPAGYKVVTKYMQHGPCGKDIRYAACTNDGKYSKHFPKPFLAETFLDEEGYPHYRRRDNKLSFYLHNQNAITLRDSENLPALLQREGIDVTMFTDWGVTGFEHLMTINHRLYATFKDVCFAYGLLNDDIEWTKALSEASLWALGPQLRVIFITIFGRSLTDFKDLPQPIPNLLTNMDNRLIREALDFDIKKSKAEHEHLHSLLNPEQRLIYEDVVQSVHHKKGNFYFIYGPGGTGKTFLYQTIISRLRSERRIVLAVASSGIASLLLPAGRTAHSRFVIPLDLIENNTCGIKQNTQLAELMQEVQLIIWDEAPMTQRYAFEALDITLRDILGFKNTEKRNQIFEGMTVLLGGDFRQILPVIQKAKRPEIVQDCINRSELWNYCKIFTLTRSMRVNKYCANGEIDTSKQEFNRWVLAVGDGTVQAKMKEREDDPTWIDIPEKFLIKSWESPIQQIVTKTYPDFTSRQTDDEYLKERAILTPRNDDAEAINEFMFKQLSREPVTYYSADEICKASTDNIDQHQLYLIEFLNSLNFLGTVAVRGGGWTNQRVTRGTLRVSIRAWLKSCQTCHDLASRRGGCVEGEGLP